MRLSVIQATKEESDDLIWERLEAKTRKHSQDITGIIDLTGVFNIFLSHCLQFVIVSRSKEKGTGHIYC